MESITVYCDQGDGALRGAQIVNSLSPTPECKSMGISSSCRQTVCPALGRSATVLRRKKSPSEEINLIEESSPLRSNLLSPPPRKGALSSQEEMVDCDVIDTSLIKESADKSRHNYFHLIREMLEDTREILVTGKRASLRKSRLVLREGNLYGWLQAPPK